MLCGTDINLAANFLREGKIIAIPTETVYGLAANAFNVDAVSKIYSIKKRPAFNPLIIHISSIENLDELVINPSPVLLELAKKFWPGPLTILFQKSDKLNSIVTAGSNFVAIRIPSHPLAQQLLTEIGFPLAAPSANPSGYISPTTALHVQQQLGNKLEYILDGGPCTVGVESTIVKENIEGKLEILRNGSITADEIYTVTGYSPNLKNHADNPAIPGMQLNHYAPMHTLYLGNMNELVKQHAGKKIAALFFSQILQDIQVVQQCVLSPKGDLDESARNLYSCLHLLDKCDIDVIIAEIVPDSGIGKAINDRLKRASTKH